MTLKDIQGFAPKNERQIEAFGGTITIRDLTIKETKKATSLKDEDILAQMVSFAMVDPKMTVDQIEALGIKAIDELTKVVEALNGSKDGTE